MKLGVDVESLPLALTPMMGGMLCYVAFTALAPKLHQMPSSFLADMAATALGLGVACIVAFSAPVIEATTRWWWSGTGSHSSGLLMGTFRLDILPAPLPLVVVVGTIGLVVGLASVLGTMVVTGPCIEDLASSKTKATESKKED